MLDTEPGPCLTTEGTRTYPELLLEVASSGALEPSILMVISGG